MKRQRRDPLVDIVDKENRNADGSAEGSVSTPEEAASKEAENKSNKRQQRERKCRSYSHRLHYHWSQLEADCCGTNMGSPSYPLPKAIRTLDLQNDRVYDSCPKGMSEDPDVQAQFSLCADTYQTIEYNTFIKNGCLKLTEVELFFLSSNMTKESSCDWAVIYLGLGAGTRFRSLRDLFFPKLKVIAFDPLDEFFTGNREDVENDARRWSNDGTDFTFLIRCMDCDSDLTWIREKTEGRKLLLISDIRGMNFKKDGNFDKEYDQEVQWEAIKCLQPLQSLVKFCFPSWNQYFEYAPGIILKQTFCNWASQEVRLLIEGVPTNFIRYNAWEMYEKMNFHHETLRGQVYASERGPDSTACLDYCFDCTVLWDTVSAYADKNAMDPNCVLAEIMRYQIYTPPNDPWRGTDAWSHWTMKIQACGCTCAWWDIEDNLSKGRVMQAIAALEADERDGGEELDWVEIRHGLFTLQRDLAFKLKREMRSPATRGDLIDMLGSLSKPFTLLRTELNTLLDDYQEDDADADAQTPESC